MARTRTQTGTISAQKYDIGTLRLKGEVSPTSRSTSTSAGVTKSRTSNGSGSSTSRKGGRSRKKQKKYEGANVTVNNKPQKTYTRPLQYDKPKPVEMKDLKEARTGFWPSVAVNEGHDAGLSEYEKVSRQVQVWEKILEEHRQNHPLAVPQVEVHLEALKREQERLGNVKAAHEVNYAKNEAKAIRQRIEVLRRALKNSKPPAERENIQGAIAAYESGQIRFSKKYSLVWAGQVVDTCDTYAEFTVDRMERLDRYEREYGPHWIWIEEPLDKDTNRMMRCGAAYRESKPDTDIGMFLIQLGYQKRVGMVTRQSEFFPNLPYESNDTIQAANPDQGGAWRLGDGPRLIYRSILDTGASFCSLYQLDLEALGIDFETYPAQTVASLSTAAGIDEARCYELEVEMLDENFESLIDPKDPIHPQFPPKCGWFSLTTAVLNGRVYSDLDDPSGRDWVGAGNRLSSLMPFVAAYVSSTPGNNVIVFGEDRNDVLGFAKMPPGRRWVLGATQEVRGREIWDTYGNPLITFTHRNGDFIDQDIQRGVEKATVFPGTSREHQEISDPGNRLTRGSNYVAPSDIYEFIADALKSGK